MSLLERAHNLSTEILALDSLKKRADQADVFERRANDLDTPAKEIQKLGNAISVIAGQGICVKSLDRALVGSLRDLITDLKTRYALDRNVAIDPFPPKDVRYVLIAPLGKLSSMANAALLEAWESWAINQLQLPAIRNDVLDTLGRISALRDSVARVRSLRVQADKVCKELPDSDDVVLSLAKLGQDIGVAWESLAGNGVPNEVLAFLSSAGTPIGAEYSAMTPKVLEWLSEHGLSNSLRIRMG